MAFKKMYICGVGSVGASSCVASTKITNDTVVEVLHEGAGDRVAIDSEGSFWLTPKLENHTVVRCNVNWSCADVIGDWEEPKAMAVVGDGSTVYVQETHPPPSGEGQPLMKKCDRDSDGTYSCAVLTHVYPSKLAIDAQGNLLSTISGGRASTTHVTQWTPEGNHPVGPQGSPTNYCTPWDIAVDASGNLFVACQVKQHLQYQAEQTLGWSVMKCTLLEDCVELLPMQEDLIQSIAVGPGGDLHAYVTNHVGLRQLTRCPLDGDCENFPIEGYLGMGSWSFTVDQKGDVYVTTAYSSLFRICLPTFTVPSIQV